MTSWNRGRENEEIGEQQLNTGDAGNILEGGARKIGGEIEQGLDNLGDTLTGKQNDLQGNDQNWGNRAGDAIDDAGDNMRNAADDAGDNLRNATDNAGDWIQNRGDDVRDATR
ncbi:MAG: hypothetical protein M3437_20890 [Chloroflexota bacterium]|nr:hypothetical protein [Chloroflexota bacterium]MDQ5865338.1 hypothetical protein [Chloroflexota bacterium]